jgi:hypothetical protein
MLWVRCWGHGHSWMACTGLLPLLAGVVVHCVGWQYMQSTDLVKYRGMSSMNGQSCTNRHKAAEPILLTTRAAAPRYHGVLGALLPVLANNTFWEELWRCCGDSSPR